MAIPVFLRRRATLGVAVLAPLAFCLLASFSLPCDLVIDGHGNLGDETMSTTLSSDLSFTSPVGPLPGYGYRSDGQPWTWGVNTSPLYGWFYGAALHAAPPVRRIEVARLVSRALCGAGLYLITLSLLQLVFPPTSVTWPLLTQLSLALSVALLFMNAPMFRFIASFARVEALGFFFLAAVIAVAPRVLAKPTGPSVFLFTLLSLSVAWTSYVAFYLVGFLSASVAGLSIAAHTVSTPSSLREKTLTLLTRWVLPSASAFVIFSLLSFWLSAALMGGPAGVRLFGILNLVGHPSSWPLSRVSSRPEPLWFLAANAIGLLGLVVVKNIWKGTQPAKFARIAFALLAATALYQIWLLTITPSRYTYDILITTAFAFWQLFVLSSILRDHPMSRRFMIAATIAAFVYASFHPPQQLGSLCREDVPGPAERLWPFQTLTAGFYNPFKDEAGNRSRRLHAEAVREYLRQHGVHRSLATDPMFATMSDSSLQFYYLNNPGNSIGSPAAEEQLMAGLVEERNIRYIVSSEFGESPEAGDLAGFVGLRRCVREATDRDGVCQLGRPTVRLTRVFRTDEVVHTPEVYVYGTKNSTPISIYRLFVG